MQGKGYSIASASRKDAGSHRGPLKVERQLLPTEMWPSLRLGQRNPRIFAQIDHFVVEGNSLKMQLNLRWHNPQSDRHLALVVLPLTDT